MKQDELILERKQFCISYLISKDVIFNDVYLEKHLDDMMYSLIISHKPFVKVLQQDRKIISIPNSNWDWFKSLFFLKYKRKTYYINEFISFPNYSFPKELGEPKVFIETDLYIENTEIK
jgi:hypothetical protein